MERKLFPILFVVFLLVSVFLSIELKNAKRENREVETNKEPVETQNQEKLHALAWYRELLFFNFSNHNRVVSIALPAKGKENKFLPVVFLKNGFCQSCVKDILPKLVAKLDKSGDYLIVSHPGNKPVMEAMLTSIDYDQNVIWHDDYLYGRFNNEYDAELLLLDHQNRITGIIPLEYLKIEGLLDWMVDVMM